MLLAFPLDIWETIFELLSVQDLQLISKVPRLRVILAISRRSAHRLEIHRAGLVDVSLPGSHSLAQRVELLKTYRARWENLRWTEVTRLPPRFLWDYHFAGNVLAHVQTHSTSAIRYLRLPSEGVPGSSWEDNQLGLEHEIRTFSANLNKNLLVVLDVPHDDVWINDTRLHVRRLDSTRDIVVPHKGQLKVCQPFTTVIPYSIGDHMFFGDIFFKIGQFDNHIAVLYACYAPQWPVDCSNFIMWDVITQEQIAKLYSMDYRSFVFLDHRWILFGSMRHDTDRGGHRSHPYLEIVDPTRPTDVTTLELDKSVVTYYSDTTVSIKVEAGARDEEDSLTGNRGMPFVSDTARGIVVTEVNLHHRDDSTRFESFVFVMNIEDLLTIVSSPLNPESRCVEWEDLCSSVAMFSYHSTGQGRYRIFPRESYVSGFRYASPIQPLVPENPDGPRCFFIYDFNPYRETSDSLPGAAEDRPPGMNYPRGASGTAREVIGGLSCWKTKFDLPAAGEDVKKCYVTLTDSGVVLFESNDVGEESITVFSMR